MKIENKKLIKSVKKSISYVFSLALILLYVYRWRTVPNTFGKETWIDFPGFLAGGTSGVNDFIRKIFDLSIVESCEYRPRLIAFAVQYLDLKWWMALNKMFGWGGYYPFVLVSMVISIFGMYLILRRVFPNDEKGTLILLSTFFLFQWNYFATTRIFFRTAKLMAPAVSALIVGILINLKERETTKGCLFWEAFLSLVLAIICTIDEQVIVAVVFLIGYLLINLLFKEKKRRALRVSALTVVQYVVYYFGYGRILFSYFTNGELKTHRHTFAGSLKGLFPSMIDGAETLAGALRRSLFDNWFILALLAICMGVMIAYIRSWRDRAKVLYLIFAALILTGGLVSAHHAVHDIPELRYTLYLIQSVWMIYLSFMLGVRKTEMGIAKKYGISLLICIGLLSVLYVNINIKQNVSDITLQNGEPCLEWHTYEVFLDADIIKESGIDESYFDGMLCRQQEYLDYMDGKDWK